MTLLYWLAGLYLAVAAVVALKTLLRLSMVAGAHPLGIFLAAVWDGLTWPAVFFHN